MLSTKLLGAGAIKSIIFIAKNDVNSSTITVPNTAQAGDVGILLQISINTGSATPAGTTPSGWTNIVNTSRASNAVGATRAMWSYKILVAGDVGATLTGMNFNTSNHKTVLVYRIGGGATSSITSVAANVDVDYSNNTNGVDPPALTITAAARQVPLIVFGHIRSANAEYTTTTLSDNTTPTFSVIANSGTGTVSAYGYTIYNSRSFDVTMDMPSVSNAQPRIIIQGFSLQIV
jgi:hypothetical protein